MRRLALLVLFSPLCLAALAAPAVAQVPPDDEAARVAQERFTQARDLYASGRYEEALAAFRQTIELSESPNGHLYVARSLRELGRLDEAVRELDLTLRLVEREIARSPRYAETGAAARQELDELEQRVGRVVIVAGGEGARDASVWLDGRLLPPQALGLPIVVLPGEHRVRARAAGAPEVERSISVAAGASEHVDLASALAPRSAPLDGSDAPRVDRSPPPSRRDDGLAIAGGVVLGVGVAAAAIAIPLAVMGHDRYLEAIAQCPARRCPAGAAPPLDEGRTLDQVALGLSISGAIVAVTGIVLLVIDAASGHHVPVATGLADPRVRF
jgi:hypothetical protein